MNTQTQTAGSVCEPSASPSSLALSVGNASVNTRFDSARPGDPDSASKARAKRLFDVCCSFFGLLVLAPVFVMIGVLVKMADGGDIFYRQVRVGQGGREFVIYKFRSMVRAAGQSGPSVTKDGDARITWIGRMLRKTKLDELPQLWNVLKGDMSLVGPRPEVPRYVKHYTPEQRAVLRLKPGITDLASLCFRNEEALLANTDHLEEFYIQHCIPRKLHLNQIYAKRATLLSDIWIILQTVCPYWATALACYGMLLASSFWVACQLAYDFGPPNHVAIRFWPELGITLGLQLVCLAWRTRCRGLLSYFSFTELRQICAALGLAAGGLLIWSVLGYHSPAPNLILINALLSICLLVGFRLLLRSWREHSAERGDATAHPAARVGIIGAGSAGAQVAQELADNEILGRKVVAFFDDDFHKWQKHIYDVPVAGMPECLLEGWAKKLDEIVIAMPEAPAERMREIENLLRQLPVKCYSAPFLTRLYDKEQAA